jgi:hypothetical protein
VNIDTHFLFASLIWGSVGVGYFIYGKKQQEMAPLIGGLVMIAGSYVISSAIIMSLASVGLMVAIYVLMKRS